MSAKTKDAYRRDALRFRFMVKVPSAVPSFHADFGDNHWTFQGPDGDFHSAPTLRQAVDRAMKLWRGYL